MDNNNGNLNAFLKDYSVPAGFMNVINQARQEIFEAEDKNYSEAMKGQVYFSATKKIHDFMDKQGQEVKKNVENQIEQNKKMFEAYDDSPQRDRDMKKIQADVESLDSSELTERVYEYIEGKKDIRDPYELKLLKKAVMNQGGIYKKFKQALKDNDYNAPWKKLPASDQKQYDQVKRGSMLIEHNTTREKSPLNIDHVLSMTGINKFQKFLSADQQRQMNERYGEKTSEV